jgi:hypothetical protein
MSYFKLEPSYNYKLKSMPRNGTLKETISNTCNITKHQSIVRDLIAKDSNIKKYFTHRLLGLLKLL